MNNLRNLKSIIDEAKKKTKIVNSETEFGAALVEYGYRRGDVRKGLQTAIDNNGYVVGFWNPATKSGEIKY